MQNMNHPKDTPFNRIFSPFEDLQTELTPDSSSRRLPESPETPPWGPPGELPESPETPPWGPPDELPESPETPPWGPPTDLPESPETPPFAPPPGNPNPPNMPPFLPPITNPFPPVFPGTPSSKFCYLRFLHAGANQPPVNILVDSNPMVRNLQYGDLSTYDVHPSGVKTIRVVSAQFPNITFYQYTLFCNPGDVYTISIINSNNGIALYPILDTPCNNRLNNSCIRAVNLSANSPPIDFLLSNGRMMFADVRFKDVTPHKSIRQGNYLVLAAERSNCTMTLPSMIEPMEFNPFIAASNINLCPNFNLLLSTRIRVQRNNEYTLYLIGNAYGFPALQMLFAESYVEF